MGEQQRRELSRAEHEREVAELLLALDHIDIALPPAQKVQQHAVYLRAQMIKHQISVALLEARLGGEPPALTQ